MEKNDKDLSGTVAIRMLDFGQSQEILYDVFSIVKANSLGAYKIENDKKEDIKRRVKEELNAIKFKSDFGYTGFLRTYPSLEGRFFLEDELVGNTDVTSEPEEVRKYFSHIAKKYVMSISFDSKNCSHKANVYECISTLPAGFFDVEQKNKE